MSLLFGLRDQGRRTKSFRALGSVSERARRIARTRALIFPIHGSFVRPWIHDGAKSKGKPADGWYGRTARVWRVMELV